MIDCRRFVASLSLLGYAAARLDRILHPSRAVLTEPDTPGTTG
ncbi:hypothetical protein [Nocardia sp. CA-119907]